MIFDRAKFPLSGPIANPTADDYRVEAQMLRREGWPRMAEHFERVAYRLTWVPKPRDENTKVGAA